jgi:two-component system, NarL family, response regulator NreC
MTTRIVLADDHRIMREGLRSLLNSQPNMQVVGEAEDGRRTVELTRKLLPHAVVMPPENGIHQVGHES